VLREDFKVRVNVERGLLTKVTYHAVSLDAPISSMDGDETTLHELIPSPAVDVSLMIDIPSQYRGVVTQLLGGESVQAVAKSMQIESQSGIRRFRHELEEAMRPILIG
jgi:hypothetical protein